MGSSGSGNFSDYSEKKGSSEGEKSGGSSGDNKCGKAFRVSLEDVERCQYFDNYQSVPPIETQVSLIFNQRLVAIDKDGLQIGYLPTSYNYLMSCLIEGYSYSGMVSKASNKPIASVHIHFIPNV